MSPGVYQLVIDQLAEPNICLTLSIPCGARLFSGCHCVPLAQLSHSNKLVQDAPAYISISTFIFLYKYNILYFIFNIFCSITLTANGLMVVNHNDHPPFQSFCPLALLPFFFFFWRLQKGAARFHSSMLV